MHLNNIANDMTDAGAKNAFKKFLNDNQMGGGIKERSKIVRTVNRINDPGQFFRNVGPDANVAIGGRKGKTVLIGGQGRETVRVNPSKQ